MKLEDQCVSLDLAKRLKELGVKQERSLFAWSYWMDHAAYEGVNDCHEKHWEVTPQDGGNMGERYDAFTVAELGEMLPACVTTPHGYAYIESVKWMNDQGVEVRYKNTYAEKRRTRFASFDDEPLEETKTEGFSQRCATEADARAAMLCHLIEKGLVKP